MNEGGKSIANIRKEYSSREFQESSANVNPFEQFQLWFEEALESSDSEPTAMNLATVSPEGRPSSRIVLLKEFSMSGFTFYTNYLSKKGHDLVKNNFAALNFFWPELERQVRIEGTVAKVDKNESEFYFQSRPRGSQIGALASPQSQVIDKSDLEKNVKVLENEWEGKNIPCPDHWGGYIVKPDYFEFWQGRPSRLHDRITYQLENNTWKIIRIAP